MRDQMQTDVQGARAERREVKFRAFARRADGTSVNVTLLNLSYEGCLLASEEAFEIGESLRLMVTRRGVVDAHVRWIGGGKLGVRFADNMAA